MTGNRGPDFPGPGGSVGWEGAPARSCESRRDSGDGFGSAGVIVVPRFVSLESRGERQNQIRRSSLRILVMRSNGQARERHALAGVAAIQRAAPMLVRAAPKDLAKAALE